MIADQLLCLQLELEDLFNAQSAAHGAAVGPGAPVVNVSMTDGHALVLLRCSIEASNCLLFNGVQFKGGILEVMIVTGAAQGCQLCSQMPMMKCCCFGMHL